MPSTDGLKVLRFLATLEVSKLLVHEVEVFHFRKIKVENATDRLKY